MQKLQLPIYFTIAKRLSASSTYYRRFSNWVKDGRLRKALEAPPRHLEDKGLISLDEFFLDDTFLVAKNGSKVGETKRGKGMKLMVIAGASGLPVVECTDSAKPHEVKSLFMK